MTAGLCEPLPVGNPPPPGWHHVSYSIGFASRKSAQSRPSRSKISGEDTLNVFRSQALIAERVNEWPKGLSWDEIDQSKSVYAYLKRITDDGGRGRTRGLRQHCWRHACRCIAF